MRQAIEQELELVNEATARSNKIALYQRWATWLETTTGGGPEKLEHDAVDLMTYAFVKRQEVSAGAKQTYFLTIISEWARLHNRRLDDTPRLAWIKKELRMAKQSSTPRRAPTMSLEQFTEVVDSMPLNVSFILWVAWITAARIGNLNGIASISMNMTTRVWQARWCEHKTAAVIGTRSVSFTLPPQIPKRIDEALLDACQRPRIFSKTGVETLRKALHNQSVPMHSIRRSALNWWHRSQGLSLEDTLKISLHQSIPVLLGYLEEVPMDDNLNLQAEDDS